MSGMHVMYKCPVCKEVPVMETEEGWVIDRTKAFFTGKPREKMRGGKYLEYHTCICKSCGTCYAFETIESSIFEDKDG